MKKWFSKIAKSTALAVIAIAITVSIAWAAVTWPNPTNNTAVTIKAPISKFVENNAPGIFLNPNIWGAFVPGSEVDAIDFRTGEDEIRFGEDDAAIEFSSGGGNSIQYIDGTSSTNDLLAFESAFLVVESTAGDLILDGKDTAELSSGSGAGPSITVDKASGGDIIIQMADPLP
jgi:hypothetical protein